jgi:hypothetical protein
MPRAAGVMANSTDLPGELIGAIVDPSAINAASALAEVGIDALLDDGLLRDIPVVGTLVSLARTGIALRDRIFAKKIARFLLQLNEVHAAERGQFHEELTRDPKRAKVLGETLIVLLDRIDDVEKARLLAQSFAALLQKKISETDFHRLCRAVDRIILASDSAHLANWAGAVQKLPQEIGVSLSAAGLLELNSDTVYVGNGRDYRKTRIGELAASILL